jgi:hypothetical protein
MFGTNYYSELGKDKAKAHGTTEQASSGGSSRPAVNTMTLNISPM